MGLLASLLFGTPRASTPAPDNPFWYGPVGMTASSGMAVTEETALAISAVYRCVKVIASAVARLPLIVYRRRADGGKDRATNHPLYTLLHDAPNDWQTAKEFREMLQGHLLLRGNAYAEILPGPRGFADQLIPLHPDRVRPKQLDSHRIVYEVWRRDGRKETLVQDEVFHLRGLSSDGVTGLSVLDFARESLGLARSAEGFGARMFGQRPMMAGILRTPGKLTDEASKRVADSFARATTGPDGWHRPAVLEEGLEWVSVGVTPEDAQFLETRRFQIADISRWFGVPLALLNETEKTTSWGTGIEQFMLAFVIHTLTDWLVTWEQAIGRDLILAPETYFAEHLIDALLRGSTKERFEAYQVATGGRAWMSPNEVRSRENMNPEAGLDEISRDVQGAAPAARRAETPPARQADDDEEAAARAVRRELAAVRQAAASYATNAERWRAWAERWYQAHAAYLVGALSLSEAAAREYCRAHQAEVVAGGVAVTERWEIEAGPALVALANGEEA